MDKRKKAINSLMEKLKIRPKVIGVAAVVAILLMLILALSGADSAQEIRFTGTVTDKNPPGQIGSLWWDVTADEIISGPEISCDTLRVRVVISPPWGDFDSDIAVGDRVDVYGNYTSNCTVSLNGESYYIVVLAVHNLNTSEDFATIQLAIDGADTLDGHTILVDSGMYHESVNVTKQLILRGNDTGGGKPVVDAGGNGSAITLSHNGIVLDGFTAINTDGWPIAGILVYSHNNSVTNNTVSDNRFGIYLFSACNNTLAGNIASNNDGGIHLDAACNNTLMDNTALNNSGGIYLMYANNNILTDNTANGNVFEGISLFSSNNNMLTGNTANENDDCGIHLSLANNNTLTGNTANENGDCGIKLFPANNNSLTDNTANLNNDVGIYLKPSSNNNILTSNNASNNHNYGIVLEDSSNNTLTSNTASSHHYQGIHLYSSSNNNVLTNNTANTNNIGMFIQSSNNNTLTGNTAVNNDLGIYLTDAASNNHIYNNYFKNEENAHDTGNNIWNITRTTGINIVGGSWLGGNYWSDYTGEDINSDGLGDTLLPYDASGDIVNGGDLLPLVPTFLDTGEGGYPSISGMHNGTITPFHTLTVSTLYTYPCSGTGGHAEYMKIWNSTGWNVTAQWNGYTGYWHNLSFNNSFTLYAHETYNYTIQTGSYPQIIHATSYNATAGKITCEEFVDVNGKRHEDWIPAIRLYLVDNLSTDLTYEEARAIAENSTCVQEGTLTDTWMYNEYTRTWWIDLEPFTVMPGCNPACVISEDTRTAEINWRCTM
jgi:nitrous oxidase accessory protein